MVFGLSKEEREERKHQKQLDRAADREAERARRDARRSGKIKGATKRGYQEGIEQGKKGGGGILGALSAVSKHIEVGPQKSGKNDSGFGLGTPSAKDFDFGSQSGPGRAGNQLDDIGLGLGSQRGKKKKDPYAELGL